MIATRPPDLLYVAFQTARQMIVNHIANIVFINAHAKSTGSTNDLQLSLHELLLNAKAINCRNPSVICRDLKSSHFTQPVCQLIGQLAAGKIYNPAATQLMQPFSQPLPLLLANPSPENQAQLLWRFTWPFAAFNLALLAVPLSCTSPRAGRSLNLIFAALIFVLYLNGISICETWVEQERLSLWGAFALLNGTVFFITVVLFIRRVYMMRWLPSWCSLWYLRERLKSRRPKSAEEQ